MHLCLHLYDQIGDIGFGDVSDVGDLHLFLPDRLFDGAGHNAILLVIGLLHSPPLLRFVHCRPDGAGHAVGVEHHPRAGVPGGPAYGLDEALLIPQKALFVGIKYANEAHLGNVQPLPQQVDSHEHIELAQAQLADDLRPLQGVDVRVQVAGADLVLGEKVGQLLRQALGEGRHQSSVAAGYHPAYLGHHVPHLALDGPDLNHRVEKAGGPYDLLDHLD